MSTPKNQNVRKNRPAKGRSQNTKHVAGRQTTAPVAYSQALNPFRQAPSLSRRIKNSEFVADVIPSSAFSVQTFPINPGIALTFPWLSGQASNWQQYRFHSLTFRFVTRSPTSIRGSVILSPEYNVSDQTLTNEREAMNTMDAVEDVVWKSISTRLNVNAMYGLGPRKQIRPGPMTGDLTVYDAGSMRACTSAVTDFGPSAVSVGKLWVDYDVELFVPQTQTGPLPPISTKILTAEFFLDDLNQTANYEVLFMTYPIVTGNRSSFNTIGAYVGAMNSSTTSRVGLFPGAYLVQYVIHFSMNSNPTIQAEASFRMWDSVDGVSVGSLARWKSANTGTGNGNQNLINTVSNAFAIQVLSPPAAAGVPYRLFSFDGRAVSGADMGGGVYMTVLGGNVIISLL